MATPGGQTRWRSPTLVAPLRTDLWLPSPLRRLPPARAPPGPSDSSNATPGAACPVAVAASPPESAQQGTAPPHPEKASLSKKKRGRQRQYAELYRTEKWLPAAPWTHPWCYGLTWRGWVSDFKSLAPVLPVAQLPFALFVSILGSHLL